MPIKGAITSTQIANASDDGRGALRTAPRRCVTSSRAGRRTGTGPTTATRNRRVIVPSSTMSLIGWIATTVTATKVVTQREVCEEWAMYQICTSTPVDGGEQRGLTDTRNSTANRSNGHLVTRSSQVQILPPPRNEMPGNIEFPGVSRFRRPRSSTGFVYRSGRRR